MMNMTMNNLLNMMVNATRRGGTPTAIARNMAATNPQMRQFYNMVNGKSTAELKQMAENMAKERGVSINDVARQLGITIPSDR